MNQPSTLLVLRCRCGLSAETESKNEACYTAVFDNDDSSDARYSYIYTDRHHAAPSLVNRGPETSTAAMVKHY